MLGTLPRASKIAVCLSVVASGLLGLSTFVLPNAPVGPFIWTSWALFIGASFLLFPLRRFGSPLEPGDILKLKAWVVVFLAFAIAGWTAQVRTEQQIRRNEICSMNLPYDDSQVDELIEARKKAGCEDPS